ncbi:MAG: hypothetical protein WC645_02900 [Candidatus Margulisiibacteriota bacterium]
MNKIMFGIIMGALAGIIDIAPMIFMKLPLSAILSAFSMWVVVGLLVASSRLGLPGAVAGILIALLVLLPTAILIGEKKPTELIPIVIMTIMLGGLLGYFLKRV